MRVFCAAVAAAAGVTILWVLPLPFRDVHAPMPARARARMQRCGATGINSQQWASGTTQHVAHTCTGNYNSNSSPTEGIKHTGYCECRKQLTWDCAGKPFGGTVAGGVVPAPVPVPLARPSAARSRATNLLCWQQSVTRRKTYHARTECVSSIVRRPPDMYNWRHRAPRRATAHRCGGNHTTMGSHHDGTIMIAWAWARPARNWSGLAIKALPH